MSITEADRHRLFQALQHALGEEEAATLMEHLPPVGWADVATKRDLDAQNVATKLDLGAVETSLRHDMQALDMRLTVIEHKVTALDEGFDARVERIVHREMNAATNRFVSWMVGVQASTFAAMGLLKVFG